MSGTIGGDEKPCSGSSIKAALDWRDLLRCRRVHGMKRATFRGFISIVGSGRCLAPHTAEAADC